MGVEPTPEEQTQPKSGGRHLGGKQCTHTQIRYSGNSIGLFLAMLGEVMSTTLVQAEISL